MGNSNVIKLYKYRRDCGCSLKMLKKHKIWFSDPKDWNDPFDYNSALLDQPLEECYTDEYDKNGAKINQKDRESFVNKTRNDLKEYLKNIGICCFSKVPDNILMWSHYTNGHNGFCIEFSFDINNKEYKDNLRDVKYDLNLNDLNILSEDIENAVNKILAFKANDWSYEKEVRIINEYIGWHEFKNGEITGVIFGLKMPVARREKIKKYLSKNKNLKFYEAKQVKNNFKLEIIPWE